jgi:SOS-response transcriptional repressor LexA
VYSSPDPDHEEYPPPGRESLVGPRGFGVIVRGESMAGVGIHDNDVVWINPDRPYRQNRPVLARVWDDDGNDYGMAVKTIRTDGEVDRLWSEPFVRESHPSTALGCKRFEVIGPVVGISPAFRVPS